MTDATLRDISRKYGGASDALRRLVLTVVNHIEETMRITPTETTVGHLGYTDDFVLLEIRPRVDRLVIDLYRRPDAYVGIGIDEFLETPRTGSTRIGVRPGSDLESVFRAIGHARKLKDEKLAAKELRRRKS